MLLGLETFRLFNRNSLSILRYTKKAVIAYHSGIKLGKATATKEEIVEISNKAHIDEFICKY